ncbi:MAG: PHP domain-containing protein [Clostridia bacterium]|nr:PHP domain-containing protein [Clostridia bacterium]
MIGDNILTPLNAATPEERLANLRELAKTAEFPETDRRYINNHIHTIYSFSPYSPTAAVWAAKAEGLATAGIVDHDSIGGAEEFLAAGEILNMPVTIGMECRVSMAGTPFETLRTNNPDQPGVSYMTMQAVPHGSIGMLQAAFEPLRARREERNRKMIANINSVLDGTGVVIDYDADVRPLSEANVGGSVTERHLMLALARKLIAGFGKGGICDGLASVGVDLSEKQVMLMQDTASPYFEYDLLGILKGAFVKKIYVPATDECLAIADAAKLAADAGAIFCYAYLGDVTDSVTGDKAAQKFEDDYLDELVRFLADMGVQGITDMPTRNTPAQLDRIRGLADKHGLMQVSGEDINSPRQSFVVRAMENPKFENLIDSAWELIRHENR